MKHLGDIRRISGGEIEAVDCITFGSPCQDLSIAGKRAGLGGERSGLFLEAVRIIGEMRETTNGIYPAFAVWENVPGAFSSNKGEDFRTVLGQLAQLKEPGIVIPRPEKGKWKPAGYILGDSWSIAWRIMDAQYWGVPQRRRRIALVMDFRGQRAGEILFKPQCVPGDSETGGKTREADLQGADLWEANLRGADLREADLRGANLDYSCWPLWCGSLGVKVDKRIAVQLAYHFCSLICDAPEYLTVRNSLIDFANQFHRVDECGKLERIEVKEEKGEVCK